MKLLGNIVEFHDPCSLCELLNASRRGRIQRACVKRSRDHIQALVLVHVRVHQRRPSASQDQKRSRVVLAAPSICRRVGSISAVGGMTRRGLRSGATFSHYTGRCAPRLLLRLTNLQMCSGVIRVGCGKASMDYLRELVARPAGSMDDCHQVTTLNSNRPQPIARLSPLCNLSSFRQRLQPRACSTTGGHAGSQADCHRQQRSCCRAGSRHAKYCHVHGKRRPTGNAWQGEPRRREPRVGRAGG